MKRHMPAGTRLRLFPAVAVLLAAAAPVHAGGHVGRTEAVLVEEVASPNNFPWQHLTHGAMHAHAHNGNLVVSWFGGTEEGESDVSVWVTVKEKGVWVKGLEVDNGGREGGEPGVDKPGPMWQSPLFQPAEAKAPLILHLHPGGWRTNNFFLRTSGDGGKTWSARINPPSGPGYPFRGAAKNRPLCLPKANAAFPAGTLLVGSEIAETATNVRQRVLPAIEVIPPEEYIGGEGWRRIALPITNPSQHVIQPTFVVLDPRYNNLLAITRRGNGAGPVFRSTDGGASWTKLSSTATAGGRGAEVASLDIGGGPAQGWHVMAVDDRGARQTNVLISRDGISWNHVLRLKGGSTYPTISQDRDRRLHVAAAGNSEVVPSPVIGWNVVRHYVLDPDVLVGLKTPSGPPAITMQPRDQGVYPGWTPYFYCLAAGETGLTYQWQDSADGGASWSNVPGASAPEFQPVVALSDDGKLYRCRVTNARGIATSNPARLSVSPVPTARRKVLHLKFDEAAGHVAADASGNGRDATVRNTASFAPGGGKLGGALEFSGGHGDWEAVVERSPDLFPITVSDVPAQYPVSQWTVSFWVKAQQWGTIFDLGQEAASALRVGRKRTDELTMEIHQQTVTAAWPNVDEWHHLAFTFDGNTFRYYLDENEMLNRVIVNKYLPPHFAVENNLELGGTWWGPRNTPAFKGLLDDLRYYDFGLTPAEIGTIMGGGEVQPRRVGGPTPKTR